MNEKEFKELYDQFSPEGFDEKKWDDALNEWQNYYDLIDNGLTVDRWLKNDEKEYLPYFLEGKEKFFGRARLANFEQAMLYQYTGKDENRDGKYYSAYQGNKYFEDKDKVKDDFEKHVRPLLKGIIDAKTMDKVYEMEKNTEYDRFRSKQILRKISVLNSVMDDSYGYEYKNKFLWVYGDDSLEIIAKVLGVEFDSSKTFFYNNQVIYEHAKKLAGIDDKSMTKEEYHKLTYFLWSLREKGAAELTDFNSINIIYNGAPGTGKTYSVTRAIKKLQNLHSETYKDYKYIQFHPAYTYQDFIEGIKPLGVDKGNLDLQVVNGSFKKFCIDVRKKNEDYYGNLEAEEKEKLNLEKPETFSGWPHYFFVVDEINRGDLSSIFGETFTLLEKDYRDYDFSKDYSNVSSGKINLISTALSEVITRIDNEDLIYKKIDNKAYFGIPFNIHFIGMMNDVDRSVDSFDLALRRRFKWISKYCDYEVIEDELEKEGFKTDDILNYSKSCNDLNRFICETLNNDGLRLGRNFEIGHAFFLKIRNINSRKTINDTKKKEVFENYIEGTLKEYIRQVDDDSKVDEWIKKAKKAFGI